MLITSLCCVLLSGNVTADTLDAHLLPDASIDASSQSLRTFVTSTSPVQSISDRQMQALGIQQVADALKLMNGVSIKDYGGLGGMKCVSVRNLGAQHTGVMYDGVPVSNCQAGQIDIARFHSQQMQEVRLGIGMLQDLKAPASMEGYSGVLSLRSSLLSDQPAIGIFANYSNWNTLQLGANASNAHGFGSSLNYRHTDGDRHNSRMDDGAVEFNYHHTGSSTQLTSKAYGYYTDRQLPGSVILYNNVANETMQEGNLLAQVHLEHELLNPSNIYKHSKTSDSQSPLSLFATVKYNHALTFYNDGKALPNDPPKLQHQYNYWQNEYYGSIGVIGCPLQNLHVSLVYDVQQNHLHSNLTTAHSVDRIAQQEVLRAQYLLSWLSVQGSLLATQFEERDKHHNWAPSLSASLLALNHYRLQIRVRGMARKAYRLSSFNEEYYYPFGQHDLRPERADEVNVGTSIVASRAGFWISGTLDYYCNRVKDKIIAFPTTFAWKMSNLGKATSQGLEASVNVQQSFDRWRCELTANYQLQQTRNLDNPNNWQTYRKSLPYMPRNCGNGSVSLHLPWCTLGYTIECVGQRYSSTMNRQEYRLEPFQCHNLTIGRQWQQLRLQASVLNLTDAHYSIIQFYPMPTRQFQLSIHYNFK